jgi:hypothetical protein
MRGWAGPPPCPHPPLRWRSRGGGEGGRVVETCPAWGFWAGKGDLRQADFHGKILWRVILAHLFGGSFWHIYLAGFCSQEKASCWAKKEKVKEMYNQWICRLHNVIICDICALWTLYIASNIVLFALVAGSTEPANSGLATVVIVDLWILLRWKYTSWRRSLVQFLLFSTVGAFLVSVSLHPRGAGGQ